MSEAMNLLTRADHLARDILLDSHDALLAPDSCGAGRQSSGPPPRPSR